MWQYMNNPRYQPGGGCSCLTPGWSRGLFIFSSFRAAMNLIIVSNCRPDYSNILIIFFNVLSLLNSKWNSKKRCI